MTAGSPAPQEHGSSHDWRWDSPSVGLDHMLVAFLQMLHLGFPMPLFLHQWVAFTSDLPTWSLCIALHAGKILL
jgi:hypothetical protein